VRLLARQLHLFYWGFGGELFMIPTATRVQKNTADEINQAIKQQTERNINFYAEHPGVAKRMGYRARY